MDKKRFVIDGENFNSLDGFYKAIDDNVLSTQEWGHNLDALNDVFSGGYGTPEEGFILVWKNFGKSKEVLGADATLKWLEDALKRVHPSNAPEFQKRIDLMRSQKGETLWMVILDIITSHKGIELRLE